MTIKVLALAGLLGLLGGCHSASVEVSSGDPAYYEEGTVYGGAVLTEPASINDWVNVNNGWYYYHPDRHVWVHTHHDEHWQPQAGAHVYHNWNEHPEYRRSYTHER